MLTNLGANVANALLPIVNTLNVAVGTNAVGVGVIASSSTNSAGAVDVSMVALLSTNRAYAFYPIVSCTNPATHVTNAVGVVVVTRSVAN